MSTNLKPARYFVLLYSLLFSCRSSFAFVNYNVRDTSVSPFSQVAHQADSLYSHEKWQNAAILYKKMLADTPSNALYHYRLGYANFMSTNYPDALLSFKKAIELKVTPQLKFAMYGLIQIIYEKLNKPKEALDFFSTAVKNGFSNYIALQESPLFTNQYSNPVFESIIEKAKRNAFPCLSDPLHSTFDFWVGEWDVYKGNIKVGMSSVVKEDGGCVILEHFQSLVSPGSGHSINYINKLTQKWEQVYSGSGGATQFYTNGEYLDNALHFVYQRQQNGTPAKGRFTFFNEGPNQVRQLQDISIDNGQTYQTLYDFIYKRRKDKVIFSEVSF
jgi:tetratricopeptide (TPR) repeat protein